MNRFLFFILRFCIKDLKVSERGVTYKELSLVLISHEIQEKFMRVRFFSLRSIKLFYKRVPAMLPVKRT
jgi:hypothetical protein